MLLLEVVMTVTWSVPDREMDKERESARKS